MNLFDYSITYFSVISTALLVSHLIIPYLMDFIKKNFSEPYQKDVIIIISISISLPISMFFIEPYLIKILK